ncbi:hypothetical protein [Trichloromonas sp.]|uniref:hypothetical protein n=1 Tax=Trichloromonas sp. TaxID=3069249 RepID=UPI003D81932B
MKLRNLLVALTMVLLTAGAACADLDSYLNRLTASTADPGQFRADLGAHFGASGPEIDLVLRTVTRHGEAVLCFWLQQQSRQPLDVVLREYQAQRQQGWGALAKSLGIKPGSDAFHALKRGELGWLSEPGGKGGKKEKAKGPKK